MKKNKKIILIIGVILTIVISFVTISYGFGIGDITGDESGKPLITTGNKIVTILTIIGAVISVIVLIILGIKYMMGSVEERAEYKKTMLPYVVGATLVFAASTLSSVIYNIANNL